MKNIPAPNLFEGFFIILTILVTQPSYAAPVAIDFGFFSGSEIVLTFDELSEDQLITNNYITQGVDFSNSLHVSASTSSGSPYEAWHSFNNPGDVVLQNLQNSNNYNSPLITDFTSPTQLIGFNILTNPSYTEFSITSALSGGVTTLFFDTNIPESFLGFYDPDGISRLMITSFDYNNTGAIAINDLRFGTVTAVPLPSSLLLFLSGLAAIYRKRPTTKIA
jgi:hypothetical protein